MLFKNKKCSKCGTNYDITFEKCPNCRHADKNFESLNIPKSIFWANIGQQLAIFILGCAFGFYLLIQFLFSLIFKNAGFEENLYTLIVGFFTYFTVSIGHFFIIFDRKEEFRKHFANWKPYLYGLVAGLIVLAFNIVWGFLMTNVFHISNNDNQQRIVEITNAFPVASILIFGLLTPICEEFTYRVGLYSLLRRLNKWVAIIVSSIVFGVIHFSWSSQDLAKELIQLPCYILVGFAFGLVYEKKGPAASIFAHSFYNVLALLQIIILS